MDTQSPFIPGATVSLQLDGDRHLDFVTVKVYEPLSNAAVILAHCPDFASPPVIIKIYDPRYLNQRFKRFNGDRDRPWSLQTEAAAAIRPPLRWESDGVGGELPGELYEDEPTSTPEKEYRAAGWEIFYQGESKSAYESELGAYERLRDVQGTMVPRLLGDGYYNPPDRRYFKTPALIIEYIQGMTAADAPAAAFTAPIVAQLYQDLQVLGSYGVIHNDVDNMNNILLGPQRAIIIDFGSADVRKDDESPEEWEQAVQLNDEKGALRPLLRYKRIPWQPAFHMPPYELPPN